MTTTTMSAKSLERYVRPLLNFARDEIRAQEALGRLAPGELTAEDVVDAAVLEAIRGDGQRADRLAFPRLRTLCRRVIEREVRRHPRQRSLFEPVGTGLPDDSASCPPRRLIDVLPNPSSPVPERVVDSLEFQGALAAILRELPTDWREPFLLNVRDGLSIREVAQLEGMPPAEVRHRIDLAREFLRAKLAEEYQDSSLPPPTETLFELLDRIEPTPEQVTRTRASLEAAQAA